NWLFGLLGGHGAPAGRVILSRLTARHDEGDVAFAECKLHRQHRERFKQARRLEFAGVDRLKADIGDEAHDDLLVWTMRARDQHGGLAFREVRPGENADAGRIEGFEEFRLSRLAL